MANKLLTVQVITPRTILYEGTALSVTSVNSQGRFDILPEHANFITLIENQPIEIKKENRQLVSFGFSKAIIYSSQDKVSIYAEPHSISKN